MVFRSLLSLFTMAGCLILSGCGPDVTRNPIPAPPEAPPATAPGVVYWSQAEAEALIAERDSHRAKADGLEAQLGEVRKRLDALKAEESRIAAELKAEKLAAARVVLYWWLGVCAIVAAACTVAGFVFSGASKWLWRGAVGFAALAALLGAVAALLAWWVWAAAGAALLVAGGVVLDQMRSHGTALRETVQGFQNLKGSLGDTYKETMSKAQSPRSQKLIDNIRGLF